MVRSHSGNTERGTKNMRRYRALYKRTSLQNRLRKKRRNKKRRQYQDIPSI